ncbi:hypothetical protein AOLI_G00294250 [Acnodon oligacanthus]
MEPLPLAVRVMAPSAQYAPLPFSTTLFPAACQCKLEVGSGTAHCPTPDTSDLWHLIQDDDTQWQDGLTASAIPAKAQSQPGHSEEQPSAMPLSASL